MGLDPHGFRAGLFPGSDRADNLLALGHWNITPFQTPVASVVTATGIDRGCPKAKRI